MNKIFIATPFFYDGYPLVTAMDNWKKAGWSVAVPVFLRAGFFHSYDWVSHNELATRDGISCLLEAKALAVMPNWQQSAFCTTLAVVASMSGFPIYNALSMDLLALPDRLDVFKSVREFNFPDGEQTTPPAPVTEYSVLEEAHALVNGPRQSDYGHPLDDFSKTAKIWESILGVEVTPEQVGLCMVGVKISRETNRHKRDNLVDGIGYFLTIDKIIEEKERRLAAS